MYRRWAIHMYSWYRLMNRHIWARVYGACSIHSLPFDVCWNNRKLINIFFATKPELHCNLRSWCLQLGKGIRPKKHPLLLAGAHSYILWRCRLARHTTLYVCTRVVGGGTSLSASPLFVFFHDPHELLLNARKGVEGDVCDIVLLAVLLEAESSPGEEHIRLSCGRKIRDSIADEDNQGNSAIVISHVSLGLFAGFLDG